MPEIKRELYVDRLLSKRGNGKVKIITGIRRCGKSYLLSHLFKDRLLAEGVPANHILEIALDDALTLSEAHAIAEGVHDDVEQAFSQVKHIMIHVNPVGEGA